MSRNTLTDKERIFALAVADGKSQYEAYCIAYNTKTDRRNTVDCNASKVANKPEVKAYIQELINRKEAANIYSDINDINKRYALIWERIAACQEKGDDAAISRYMDIINKMTGTYVNINKNINEEEEKPFSHLSVEELKSFIAQDQIGLQ